LIDNKKVLVIGGGSGQSIILRGLKQIETIDLYTIVTVADDGGSTGRLRRAYDVPAMGDIRRVMIALTESESLFSTLMSYRFDELEGTELGGHNLGNIILTALTQKSGSFMEAISLISKVLNVKGDIIPSTTQRLTLFAKMADGTIVRGESNIPSIDNHISEVYYEEKVKATTEAIKAIEKADVIIFGLGSLYTSICPNLIIPDIQKALKKTKAIKLYFCNVMSQAGETDGYSLEDHVFTLEKHAKIKLDMVITVADNISSDKLKRYAAHNSYPILINEKDHSYRILKRKLLSADPNLIRHDPMKIKMIVESILKEL